MVNHAIPFLIATSTFGCGVSSIASERAWAQMATITLSEAQDGSTVQLPHNSSLVVRLPAQLGTGFSWAVMKQNGHAVRLSKDYVETGHDSLPGGKEAQVFVFAPIGAGAEDIELAYRQPWLQNQPPARTFHIHVFVSNSSATTNEK